MLPVNYFHNQIIKNQPQARLFCSDNYNVKDFDSHLVGIRNHLSYLVEDSIREHKEDPKALLEDYLHIPYSSGDTIDEIVDFLLNTHFMTHALGILKDHWNNLDESVPSDSLLYSSPEINEQYGLAVFLEGTFRDYLETLSQIYHD